jgi:hypothetical protein
MMPPHRQVVATLELALECLDVATGPELEGYLPHWGQTLFKTMAEELAEALERLGRENPKLAPAEEPC